MQNLFSKLKKEDGSGLILALMTLMVLAVLGASLGAITVGSFRLSNVNRDSTSAYYIAEAGANQAYEEIKGHVYVAHENTSSQGSFFDQVNELSKDYADGLSIAGFSEQFGDSPESFVTLDKVETNERTVSYKLTSKGTVDGKERLVEKMFHVTYVPDSVVEIVPEAPENVAIISNGSVDLHGGGAVKGEVWVPDESTEISNSHKIDNIKYPIENWDQYVKLLDMSRIFSEEFKPLTQNKITTNKGDELFYETKTLNAGELEIEGDGIVHILVTEMIDFSNKDKFGNENKPENVRLYYTGNEDFRVRNSIILNAAIFVESARVSLDNHVIFNGVFLYGGNKAISISNHNNITAYMIAPNAAVEINNHVNFNGSIVAGSISNVGNTSKVTYKEVGSYPFSFKGTAPDEGTDSDSESDSNGIISPEPIIETK
ncbi:MAG: pilus assembly PilX N-terminal domain-containing protein [Alkalibacterium sp.]|nr:pilus assembly PilX N-terminal domain-containing protein [Alkalibacterium sp.]